MGALYSDGVSAPTTSDNSLPFTGAETWSVDTNTSQGINPSQIAPTFSQAATYFSGAVPWVTGRFYGLPKGTTPVALLTVTATLYAYPLFVPNDTTVSTLNISCTTGQTGGACRMGIYRDNSAGYPGDLIYDSGAVSGLTSTTVVTKTGVATDLVAGLYWIASIFTASGTFPSVAGITANYSVETNAALGSDTAAHALATSGQAATGITVAGTYGALPTTFTSGGALVLNAAVPLIAIGV